MLMDSTKRLYRSRNERMIAGVCGGLGQFLGVDPTVIRLIFVAGVLVGFAGVLAYLILAVVIPLEP
jgi:phage shock protein C